MTQQGTGWREQGTDKRSVRLVARSWWRGEPSRALLEEDEEDKEEEPEEAHGVPVPGGAVDGDLTHLDALEAKHGDQREDQRGDAEQQVGAVGPGDEIEEVSVGIGGEEESLPGELPPGDPLAAEEGAAEHDGGNQPGSG